MVRDAARLNAAALLHVELAGSLVSLCSDGSWTEMPKVASLMCLAPGWGHLGA